ncbi:Mth938-like domain-containing protein [Pseudomonadota bacterium]
MQVNHDFDINIHRIKSYAKGEIQVVLPFSAPISPTAMRNEDSDRKSLQVEKLNHSAVVMPGKLIMNWPVDTVDDLTREYVQELVELKPELVLIGTGEKLIWPSRALLAPLTNANIGYEIMGSAAACRTYNILAHEGRDVTAALMMI